MTCGRNPACASERLSTPRASKRSDRSPGFGMTIASFGEPLPRLALEDLAGGVARQVVDEEDVLGTLEVRQLLSGVCL